MPVSGDDLSLELVPAYCVEITWPSVLPFLQSASDRGPGWLDMDAVKSDCATGKRNLWRVVSRENGVVAGCVTTVSEEDGERVMDWTIFAARGMRSMMDLEKLVENTAREHGVTRMRSYSRIGMERRMAPLGYRKIGVILEKDIG